MEQMEKQAELTLAPASVLRTHVIEGGSDDAVPSSGSNASPATVYEAEALIVCDRRPGEVARPARRSRRSAASASRPAPPATASSTATRKSWSSAAATPLSRRRFILTQLRLEGHGGPPPRRLQAPRRILQERLFAHPKIDGGLGFGTLDEIIGRDRSHAAGHPRPPEERQDRRDAGARRSTASSSPSATHRPSSSSRDKLRHGQPSGYLVDRRPIPPQPTFAGVFAAGDVHRRHLSPGGDCRRHGMHGRPRSRTVSRPPRDDPPSRRIRRTTQPAPGDFDGLGQAEDFSRR